MFIIKFILFGLVAKSICKDQADIDFENRLKARFEDLSKNCLDSNNSVKPAYECSGILLRGFEQNKKKNFWGKKKENYPWSKKELNVRNGAFSISFLRKDNPYAYAAFPNVSGFILYPHLKTPPASPENKLEVYCAFPMDGFTDKRSGDRGCGQSDKDKSGTSKPCHSQGINSYEQWKSHIGGIDSNRKDDLDISRNQCGFDMTTESAAADFEVVLRANMYFRTNWFRYGYAGNELRIEAWSENCAEIPIEAFFYLIDSPGAHVEAKRYRDQFIGCGGREVPVVGLLLDSLHQDITIEILNE